MTDFDPSTDAFPPGARRPDAPFRTAAPPPPTLAERLDVLEKRSHDIAQACLTIRHDVSWLTEHWHQAIDRANEQLGDRVRPGLAPVWYWAAGCLTGVGFGGLALFGLARGWF